MTPGSLTLETLKALMDSSPPIPEAILMTPRTADALLQIQRNFNHQLNAQAETMLRGIPVFVTSFLARQMPKSVRRSQYKLRAGFKHARRYWRSVGKKMQRAEGDMAYLLSTTALRTETEFVARVLKKY